MSAEPCDVECEGGPRDGESVHVVWFDALGGGWLTWPDLIVKDYTLRTYQYADTGEVVRHAFIYSPTD